MGIPGVVLDEHNQPASARRTQGLRARVGAVTAILAAQFWGLTTTLGAWQAGNAPALRTSLGFQAACTLAALTVGRSGRR